MYKSVRLKRTKARARRAREKKRRNVIIAVIAVLILAAVVYLAVFADSAAALAASENMIFAPPNPESPDVIGKATLALLAYAITTIVSVYLLSRVIKHGKKATTKERLAALGIMIAYMLILELIIRLSQTG